MHIFILKDFDSNLKLRREKKFVFSFPKVGEDLGLKTLAPAELGLLFMGEFNVFDNGCVFLIYSEV